jgi:hypothetical protein
MYKNNLVDECCNAHGMKLPKFCEKYKLSEPTLKTWRKNLPSYGKLLLEVLIENYHLKQIINKQENKIKESSKILNS